jgi:DNA-binding transcriptional regulator YiaG
MKSDEGVNPMTKPRNNVHHYLDCGLENVFLEGGFEVIDTPYGQGVTINDLDGLHNCIASCLIKKPMPLNGKEFRFLRTELDLSQTAMGDLCGRKERRLRDWEKNNEKVPEPANTIIRIVYKERYDPTVTFEGLSRDIRNLQALDRKAHEMKLVSTADGWREEQIA